MNHQNLSGQPQQTQPNLCNKKQQYSLASLVLGIISVFSAFMFTWALISSVGVLLLMVSSVWGMGVGSVLSPVLAVIFALMGRENGRCHKHGVTGIILAVISVVLFIFFILLIIFVWILALGLTLFSLSSYI